MVAKWFYIAFIITVPFLIHCHICSWYRVRRAHNCVYSLYFL